MAEIESWLRQISSELPQDHECNITDSAELYQMKTRFQTLKDKCDEKTQEFRNLNEAGECRGGEGSGGTERTVVRSVLELVVLRRERHLAGGGAATAGGAGQTRDAAQRALERRHARRLRAVQVRAVPLALLRVRPERVPRRNRVCARRVLAEAWHESGELRAWLMQEGAWLDGLQRRLRRSPDAPADAEEISEELYVSVPPRAAPLRRGVRFRVLIGADVPRRTSRTTSRTTATSGWRASRTSGGS